MDLATAFPDVDARKMADEVEQVGVFVVNATVFCSPACSLGRCLDRNVRCSFYLCTGFNVDMKPALIWSLYRSARLDLSNKLARLTLACSVCDKRVWSVVLSC